MTSVSQRCWVNKYPLEGNKYLICWEHSIPAHPAGPFPWGVMARGYHLDYFTCPWKAVPQHIGEATSPLLAAMRSWKWEIPYCKTGPAHAMALNHWKCGSLAELIISPAAEGAGLGTAQCWHKCTAAASSAGPSWGSQCCTPLQSVAVPVGASTGSHSDGKIFNSLQCK